MRQPLFVLRDSVCAGTELVAADGACHRGSTDVGGGGLSRGGDFGDQFGAVGKGPGGRWSSVVSLWRAKPFDLCDLEERVARTQPRTTNDQRPTTGFPPRTTNHQPPTTGRSNSRHSRADRT